MRARREGASLLGLLRPRGVADEPDLPRVSSVWCFRFWPNGDWLPFAPADDDADALTGEYTWAVESFEKMKQNKVYSPVFQSGQYNWRILLFPGGNNVQQLSVYLDVADSATLPQGWSRRAHFSLTVHNQKDPALSVIKDAEHHFTAKACDWGFREFVTLAEVRDKNSGFITDDKLLLTAKVRVEPQVNWWAWDSKKETGYVGLKNQGATCYMNSLLQQLFMVPTFRDGLLTAAPPQKQRSKIEKRWSKN